MAARSCLDARAAVWAAGCECCVMACNRTDPTWTDGGEFARHGHWFNLPSNAAAPDSPHDEADGQVARRRQVRTACGPGTRASGRRSSSSRRPDAWPRSPGAARRPRRRPRGRRRWAGRRLRKLPAVSIQLLLGLGRPNRRWPAGIPPRDPGPATAGRSN